MAIAYHTDGDPDFWRNLNITVQFETFSVTYIDRLKKTCRYLPSEYFNVLTAHDCFVINKFCFWGSAMPINKDGTNNIRWFIGEFRGEDTISVRINRHGAIYVVSDDGTSKTVANSFTEFMEDCVFGKRYLEFN